MRARASPPATRSPFAACRRLQHSGPPEVLLGRLLQFLCRLIVLNRLSAAVNFLKTSNINRREFRVGSSRTSSRGLWSVQRRSQGLAKRMARLLQEGEEPLPWLLSHRPRRPQRARPWRRLGFSPPQSGTMTLQLHYHRNWHLFSSDIYYSDGAPHPVHEGQEC